MYPESTPQEQTREIADQFNKLSQEQRQIYEERSG